MRILITGSEGMLAKALIKLLTKGLKCKVSDRLVLIDVIEKRTGEITKYIYYYQLDITDYKKVRDFITGGHFDFVIHTAAYTDVEGCEIDSRKAFKVNTIGTRNIALACSESIYTTMIYISSDYVFDGKKDSEYLEYDRPNPLNIYGLSKYQGEQIVQSLLTKYYIVRTSWLYGEGGRNFVDTILKSSKDVLRVVDDQQGSPTYVNDLAKAILDLIRTDIFGIWHITNSGFCSWYELVGEILELRYRPNTRVIPICSKNLTNLKAVRPSNSILENFNWKCEGFIPLRSWENALADYLIKDEILEKEDI